MITRYEITCIVKDDRFSPYERIQSIGGRSWSMPLADAIRGIENKRFAFYVSMNGKEVGVIVSISPHGHKYLKTVADDFEPNNLLSLPNCSS